jgi:hypothetical protein
LYLNDVLENSAITSIVPASNDLAPFLVGAGRYDITYPANSYFQGLIKNIQIKNYTEIIDLSTQLKFDGFNKLTIENTPDDVTGITLFHKATGSEVETSVVIGTASEINVIETGTYRAEIKAASSYTFTEPVDVEAVMKEPFNPGKIVTFAKGNATWSSQVIITDVQLKDINDNVLAIEYVYFPFSNGGGTEDKTYIDSTDGTLLSTITDGVYLQTGDADSYQNQVGAERVLVGWTFNAYDPGTTFMHVKAVDGQSEIAKVRVIWSRSKYKQNIIINGDGKTYEITAGANTSPGIDETYTLTGSYIPPPQSLTFDGYNKLTISPPDDVTGITLYHKPTGSDIETSIDIGTATEVNIAETGTYRAEIKAASSYTFTDEVVVGTLDTSILNEVSNISGNSSFASGTKTSGFSSDGNRVVIGEPNAHTIHIYNYTNNVWTLDKTIVKDNNFGSSVSISKDGNKIVACKQEMAYLFINGAVVDSIQPVDCTTSFGQSGLSISNDGNYVVIGDYSHTSETGMIYVYDISNNSFSLSTSIMGMSEGNKAGKITLLNKDGTRLFYTDGNDIKIYERTSSWQYSTLISASGSISIDENGERIAIGKTDPQSGTIYLRQRYTNSWSSVINYKSGVSLSQWVQTIPTEWTQTNGSAAWNWRISNNNSANKYLPWDGRWIKFDSPTELYEFTGNGSVYNTQIPDENTTGDPKTITDTVDNITYYRIHRAVDGYWGEHLFVGRFVQDGSKNSDEVSIYLRNSSDGAFSLEKTITGVSGESYGSSVFLNGDGNKLFIGSKHSDSGKGLIEYWVKDSNNMWNKKPDDIIGETTSDKIGGFIAINLLGTVLGTYSNDKLFIYNSIFPSISFDGFNKLTIENISDDVTDIALYHKPTGSEVETSVNIGTVSEVNINETGTYRAEIKAVSSYTYTENVVVEQLIIRSQWPPIEGTLNTTGGTYSVNTSKAANITDTWGISGSSYGNGDYSATSSVQTHTISGSSYSAFSRTNESSSAWHRVSDGGASGILTLKLPKAIVVKSYKLWARISSGGDVFDETQTPGPDGNSALPNKFTLEARSNDTDSWTILDNVQSNRSGIAHPVVLDYKISDNTQVFSQYRLNIINVIANYNLIVGEWQLFAEEAIVEGIIVRDGSSPFKPGVSAKDIKQITGTTTSGLYWISINDVSTKVYCDMSDIDGGGWTLIGKSNGTFNDPDNWLKSSVGGMENLNNADTHACIDARELVAYHSTECMLSSVDLSKWIKCNFHSKCTKDTIFNHQVGQTKIHSDGATNSESVKATAWNGSTQDCYVNVYSVMTVKSHGGSTPCWSKNTAGNTSGGDYAMGVSCATADHNGFTSANKHNGMDAPYNDTWPNPIYGEQGFKGFIWVR